LSKHEKGNFAPYLAEGLAVLVFVVVGAGAKINGTLGDFEIAVAHGLAIFLMVTAIGNISGGHINPIVTWAMMVRQLLIQRLGEQDFRPDRLKWLGYIAAQLVGAVAGAGILYGLAPLMDGGKAAAEAVNYGTPAFAEGLSLLGGFIYEMAFGFILVFVVLLTAKHPLAPFAIGGAVFADALWGGAYTGAAMNPARWLGPALISGTWDNAWVYILAPMVGATIAAAAYALLSSAEETRS